MILMMQTELSMKPIKKAIEMTPVELASYIDQSVLKPEFTVAETFAERSVIHSALIGRIFKIMPAHIKSARAPAKAAKA